MNSTLKYIFSIILASAMSICVGACGDDKDEPAAPSVTYIDGAPKSFTVDYYTTLVSKAVKFSATAEWTAEVLPVTPRSFSKVDWLEVNPYRGNAGDKALDIVLKPNTTTDSRTAQIKINSALNEITFTVTQKGTSQGGGTTPTPGTGTETN